MPDREAMITAIETHCRAESAGDKEAWVNIFAESIVIEDPVGSGNVHRGIAAVSGDFWDRAQQHWPKVQLTQAPIVSGNEAIAILKAEIGPDGARQSFAPIVAHFVFDDNGKVESLRAFFAY